MGDTGQSLLESNKNQTVEAESNPAPITYIRRLPQPVIEQIHKSPALKSIAAKLPDDLILITLKDFALSDLMEARHANRKFKYLIDTNRFIQKAFIKEFIFNENKPKINNPNDSAAATQAKIDVINYKQFNKLGRFIKAFDGMLSDQEIEQLQRDLPNHMVLKAACEYGAPKTVAKLIKAYGDNANSALTAIGVYALFWACENKNTEECNSIIVTYGGKGMITAYDINTMITHHGVKVTEVIKVALDRNDHYLLCWATKNGCEKVVIYLLELYRNYTPTDEQQKSNWIWWIKKAFQLACEYNHIKIIESILEIMENTYNHDRLKMFSENNYKILMRASENGHLNLVKMFVETFGEQIHEVFVKTNHYALNRACNCGHTNVVNYLLPFYNYNLSTLKNRLGMLVTPCEKGYSGVVESLIKALGNDLQDALAYCASPLDSHTSLRRACENGHTNIVRLLLKAYSHNLQTGLAAEKHRALWIACEKGHLEIVKLIIRAYGENIQKGLEGDGYHKALENACEKDHNEIVKILIKAYGKNIQTFANTTGFSSLYGACARVNLELVTIIASISGNTMLNIMARTIPNPLSIACEHGHTIIVTFLLNLCGDQTKTVLVNEDSNPFRAACQNGHVAIVNILLKAYGDNTQKMLELEDHAALKDACRYGHTDVVTILIKEYDVDVTMIPLSNHTHDYREKLLFADEIIKKYLEKKSRANTKMSLI